MFIVSIAYFSKCALSNSLEEAKVLDGWRCSDVWDDGGHIGMSRGIGAVGPTSGESPSASIPL